MSELTIDIGIDEADRLAITDGLSRLLADTYTLYLKTHNYHWNVTGPMFQTLHLMFEEQYNELALRGRPDRRAHPLARRAGARHLPPVRRAVVDRRGRRGPRGHRDDPPAGEGPGGGGSNGALGVPRRRAGPRRGHGRSPHPAPPGPREDRVDAAQPPGLRLAAVTCSPDDRRATGPSLDIGAS
ncbi:MAG: ferritin-like domain-containing protein [Acidimicrobiales bacterium]